MRRLKRRGVPIAPGLASAQGAQNVPSRPIRLVVASAGTLADIVARLSAGTARALNAPETRERLLVRGVEPVGSTPAQFAALDLIKLLKANPGKHNFGSSGIGTYPQLSAEMFKWRAVFSWRTSRTAARGG